MSSLLDDLKRTIADGLTSNSLTSCYRWATKRRVMGEPFPGPYSGKHHPWVIEPHESKASYNYAQKCAQVGFTEVGINRAFYTLDQSKRDVLYVLPTAGNASDFSKARFDVALEHSAYLKSIFTATNTVNLKQCGTTSLYIRGSKSDNALKSIPVSVLILDELDEMDQKQIWLALERLSGQLSKLVWAISTPTIPNFGINKMFLTGTQEHFVFKCPHCSRHTELVWPDCIEIIGETVNDVRCHESYLKCKECKHKLDHRAKPEFLASGMWQQFAVNANPDIRSFYINQLYSFTVTPGEIVVAHFRGFGDEAAAKEFHNSKLGLPFIGEGAQVTDEQIQASVRNYTMNSPRPRFAGEKLITLGIDQGKWNYWVVCEWLVDRNSRDINVAATCRVLAHGKFLDCDRHVVGELMREWQVLACVIDMDPDANGARNWAKDFPGYVWLCRYRSGKVAKEISLSDEDAPIATVDRTNWLTVSMGRFRTERIELPADVSLEFREAMKALVRTYEKDKDGNYVATFVETAPDHYAHALNYAEIALPLAASSLSNGEPVEKFL